MAQGVWFIVAVVALHVQPEWLAPLTLVPPWSWPLIGWIATFIVRPWSNRQVFVGSLCLWILFACVWVEETWSLPRAWIGTSHSGAHPDQKTLRIISFNCDGQHSAIDDLQALNPDVVLLQEAPGNKELTRWTHVLFGESGELTTCGDVSILARGKVRAKTPVAGASHVLATVTFADGYDLDCISLRLTPPPARLDFWRGGFWTEHRQLRETHRRQVHEIASRLDIYWQRTVIGGDFNTTPHDTALQELATRVTDSFPRAGRGWGATGTNSYPLFRVDQIWTNFDQRAVAVFDDNYFSALATIRFPGWISVFWGDGRNGRRPLLGRLEFRPSPRAISVPPRDAIHLTPRGALPSTSWRLPIDSWARSTPGSRCDGPDGRWPPRLSAGP